MIPRVKTHIRLGIRSVCLSDQSPRCPHKKNVGPYPHIAKFRGMSPRNREMSQSFSPNFCGISVFEFSISPVYVLNY